MTVLGVLTLLSMLVVQLFSANVTKGKFKNYYFQSFGSELYLEINRVIFLGQFRHISMLKIFCKTIFIFSAVNYFHTKSHF